MGKRRGLHKLLKKIADVLTSELVRECLRRLIRWVLGMINNPDD